MGWDRRAAQVMEAPVPPSLGRWLLAAVLAVLAGVMGFLLHAAEQVPWLQTFNIWAFSVSPLVVWFLAFGARAYAHGNVLSRYQFLQEEACSAQQSWQAWAQRYLAVVASCVLLPDQVSASALTQGAFETLDRTGQARRIADLPAGEGRAHAGLQRLIQALVPTLQALPPDQALRVTLLSDADSSDYPALRDAWQQTWSATINRPPLATVTLAGELSPCWIDETFKTATATVELVLVLQVHGEDAYSDGLAALLLCPDSLARALELPALAGVLRPMPLDVDALDSEVPMFLQTQISACQATGVLVDAAGGQPLIGRILTAAGTQGAPTKVGQQWVLERLCGLPGPLGHWLVTALGVELVRHRREPLWVVARDASQHWISTVTTGELA